MTNSPKTQICLLSGEVMPNVIGALYEDAHIVVPVASERSKPQVNALRAALKAAGANIEIREPVVVTAFNHNEAEAAIKNLALPENVDVTVNWTAGTKPMSYALLRVAQERGWRSMYVNTSGQEILLQDSHDTPVSVEFVDTGMLGISNLVHLLAAGHQVDNVTTPEEFNDRCRPDLPLITVADWIVDGVNRSLINDLKNLSRAYEKPVKTNNISKERLGQLVDASIIEPAANDQGWFLSGNTLLHPFHLNTPQEANASFLKGTFLEVFIWNQLNLRGGFDDVGWHVQLNPGQVGRVAELDVVVAHDGRFVIVECKKSLGGNSHQNLSALIEEQAARARKVGRLFGRWLLYIDIDPTEQMNDQIIASQEQRARDFGGRLVWRHELSNIHELVRDSLSGANQL